MSHGWRMRAYRDVLAASVRLWMILEKRGGFKNSAVLKTPIAGVAGAPAALRKFPKSVADFKKVSLGSGRVLQNFKQSNLWRRLVLLHQWFAGDDPRHHLKQGHLPLP